MTMISFWAFSLSFKPKLLLPVSSHHRGGMTMFSFFRTKIGDQMSPRPSLAQSAGSEGGVGGFTGGSDDSPPSLFTSAHFFLPIHLPFLLSLSLSLWFFSAVHGVLNSHKSSEAVVHPPPPRTLLFPFLSFLSFVNWAISYCFGSFFLPITTSLHFRPILVCLYVTQ